MGSKDHFLCDWVEHDLLVLSCVDTTMNMADHVTKQLGPTLFHRHIAYIMGHVPPQYTQHFQTLLGSVSIPMLTTPTPVFTSSTPIRTLLWQIYAMYGPRQYTTSLVHSLAHPIRILIRYRIVGGCRM